MSRLLIYICWPRTKWILSPLTGKCTFTFSRPAHLLRPDILLNLYVSELMKHFGCGHVLVVNKFSCRSAGYCVNLNLVSTGSLYRTNIRAVPFILYNSFFQCWLCNFRNRKQNYNIVCYYNKFSASWDLHPRPQAIRACVLPLPHLEIVGSNLQSWNLVFVHLQKR